MNISINILGEEIRYYSFEITLEWKSYVILHERPVYSTRYNEWECELWIECQKGQCREELTNISNSKSFPLGGILQKHSAMKTGSYLVPYFTIFEYAGSIARFVGNAFVSQRLYIFLSPSPLSFLNLACTLEEKISQSH